jgi:serine/threonine protein kinase
VEAMEGISMESSNLRYHELGPPSMPLDFDPPVLERGRRDQVLCYIPANGSHQVFKNVLFRNPHPLSKLKHAYWPVPQKSTIKTIMGHVEICLMLERCIRQKDEDDESIDESDEEDEEIVFELTDKMVAVKVNYVERIERLKTKHAEDPMKEISAMQLVGNDHPNVLGVMEVLFDGRNVNCVMPYCDSGDLFQLLQDSQPAKESSLQQPGQPEPVARYWFRQLVRGIQFIHSRGMLARMDVSI